MKYPTIVPIHPDALGSPIPAVYPIAGKTYFMLEMLVWHNKKGGIERGDIRPPIR